MEIASLKALLKMSRNTIASLQEQLRQKNEGQAVSSNIVLGNEWKTTSRPNISMQVRDPFEGFMNWL